MRLIEEDLVLGGNLGQTWPQSVSNVRRVTTNDEHDSDIGQVATDIRCFH